MIDIKETAKQFFMTSVLGVGTKVLSIFVSDWLDNYTNHSVSNFIGLILNALLDFFMMKRVFKVDKEESSQFVLRYSISIVFSVIVAQLLYIGFHSYIMKHYSEWSSKNWEKYVFWIRYVIGALAYGFVEFPLHKFWVFKR